MYELSRGKAKIMMKDFMNKYKGKSVMFGTLDDDDKLAYVLVSSFNYFSFLRIGERIDRCISNAVSQQKNDFDAWKFDSMTLEA